MNKRSFMRSLPYFFAKRRRFQNPATLLEMIKLQLEGSEVELEPILRWEDDGGLVLDAMFLRSSQPHTYRRPERIAGSTHQPAQ